MGSGTEKLSKVSGNGGVGEMKIRTEGLPERRGPGKRHRIATGVKTGLFLEVTTNLIDRFRETACQQLNSKVG